MSGLSNKNLENAILVLLSSKYVKSMTPGEISKSLSEPLSKVNRALNSIKTIRSKPVSFNISTLNYSADPELAKEAWSEALNDDVVSFFVNSPEDLISSIGKEFFSEGLGSERPLSKVAASKGNTSESVVVDIISKEKEDSAINQSERDPVSNPDDSDGHEFTGSQIELLRRLCDKDKPLLESLLQGQTGFPINDIQKDFATLESKGLVSISPMPDFQENLYGLLDRSKAKSIVSDYKKTTKPKPVQNKVASTEESVPSSSVVDGPVDHQDNTAGGEQEAKEGVYSRELILELDKAILTHVAECGLASSSGIGRELSGKIGDIGRPKIVERVQNLTKMSRLDKLETLRGTRYCIHGVSEELASRTNENYKKDQKKSKLAKKTKPTTPVEKTAAISHADTAASTANQYPVQDDGGQGETLKELIDRVLKDKAINNTNSESIIPVFDAISQYIVKLESDNLKLKGVLEKFKQALNGLS